MRLSTLPFDEMRMVPSEVGGLDLRPHVLSPLAFKVGRSKLKEAEMSVHQLCLSLGL